MKSETAQVQPRATPKIAGDNEASIVVRSRDAYRRSLNDETDLGTHQRSAEGIRHHAVDTGDLRTGGRAALRLQTGCKKRYERESPHECHAGIVAFQAPEVKVLPIHRECDDGPVSKVISEANCASQS